MPENCLENKSGLLFHSYSSVDCKRRWLNDGSTRGADNAEQLLDWAINRIEKSKPRAFWWTWEEGPFQSEDSLTTWIVGNSEDNFMGNSKDNFGIEEEGVFRK